MKTRIHEPTGMFQIVTVPKPGRWFQWRNRKSIRIWFTQTLYSKHQLHIGIFKPEEKKLEVWKSRDIKPSIKHIQTGMRYHPRNSLLDQPIFERIVRVPFLTPSCA